MYILLVHITRFNYEKKNRILIKQNNNKKHERDTAVKARGAAGHV